MKINNLIVNRTDNWFTFVNVNDDPIFVAVALLEKLSTNKLRGIIYSKLGILDKLKYEINSDISSVIDKAITILVARNLIRIEVDRDLNKRLFITELGIETLELYKEELNNEN
ncbi:hypothetical protein IKB17_01125 [bacterium]|nr:hypothetical protein [bacterium]